MAVQDVLLCFVDIEFFFTLYPVPLFPSHDYLNILCYYYCMELSPAFYEAYASLNSAQKRVVDTLDGPVMVVAGPGTGKTQVLGLRVANILKERDVSPNNILCLTFTDAGAVNMRERLVRFIGADAYRVGIYTFHAFCNAIISRYPEYFYDAATFVAADDISRAEVVESLFASLPHKHPLGSFHPDSGYVYQKPVMDRIKHIKSAGYTPDEYAALVDALIQEIPRVETCFSDWPERMSIKHIRTISAIGDALRATDTVYGTFLAKTLSVAIDEATQHEKTGPVGEWKKKYLEKDEDDRLVLKDARRTEKLRAVAEMYKQYEQALHDRALFDYDDMIIDVRVALEHNATLRNLLEEQYQYILVDEFQDTNEAQLRLITALSSHPMYEGRANVMVVGDDDQAIFKFQGAELSNVMNFHKMYRDIVSIVLDTNYRSHQHIIDVSRAVITQGAFRLETALGISKEIKQGNTCIDRGDVSYRQFASDIEEYETVAREIRASIASGTDPEEIAIIANTHSQLRSLLPFLDAVSVPYAYIRRESVFQEKHILELITVCAYVSSVVGDGERKEYLLPEILSYPYFHIPRTELFRIAVGAKDARKSWSAYLAEEASLTCTKVMQLLAELALDSETLPLEHVLERYMTESGFKEYYFGREALTEKPTQYVAFLASLKTFIEALRGWRDGEPLFAKDVEPFVTLHKTQHIDLVSQSPFVRAARSVQLMTAHKSKGLEFGIVYVIGAHERVWAKGARGNIAPVPAPLSPMITPAGEDEDDVIRLLYVALTRAKHTLRVTGHDTFLRYLGDVETVSSTQQNSEVSTDGHYAAVFGVEKYTGDEKAMLQDALRDYRLSVTHLNNFLDVTQGGPQYFLEQNLLRFPQPMNVAGVYGSAIDSALTEMIRYPKYNAGEAAPLDRLIGIFRHELAKGRLPALEMRKHVSRGELVLSHYVQKRKTYFSVEDETQVDFRHEGVVVSRAPISGKIDFLRIHRDGYEVVDFKTGKEAAEWEPKKSDVYEQVKLHKYKQQLMFYQLLLEGSARHVLPVSSLALEFVESVVDGEIVTLSYAPSSGELERLRKLIGAVYRKISTLDFPDISKYPKTLEGVMQFEEDLISE